jgi:hypothetical protein
MMNNGSSWTNHANHFISLITACLPVGRFKTILFPACKNPSAQICGKQGAKIFFRMFPVCGNLRETFLADN